MPRSRRFSGSDGRCPCCGGTLASIVVLHVGRREYCRACGFTREIPSPPVLEHRVEMPEQQEAIHLLLYAQAILQAVRQARVCVRCRAHLVSLQSSALELERRREGYTRDKEEHNEQQVDAFLEEITGRLQGIGELCSRCRQRMEDGTWEVFVLLELEEKERLKARPPGEKGKDQDE
jgi:hypothetical protein